MGMGCMPMGLGLGLRSVLVRRLGDVGSDICTADNRILVLDPATAEDQSWRVEWQC